jgi:hypothetical protein
MDAIQYLTAAGFSQTTSASYSDHSAYVVDRTNCHVIKTIILSLPLCQSVQHKVNMNVLVSTWAATQSQTTTMF